MMRLLHLLYLTWFTIDRWPLRTRWADLTCWQVVSPIEYLSKTHDWSYDAQLFFNINVAFFSRKLSAQSVKLTVQTKTFVGWRILQEIIYIEDLEAHEPELRKILRIQKMRQLSLIQPDLISDLLTSTAYDEWSETTTNKLTRHSKTVPVRMEVCTQKQLPINWQDTPRLFQLEWKYVHRNNYQ
jgi:hypothetical protein